MEEPQPEGLRIGASTAVDFNADGIIDLRVRYFDFPVCISAPEGGPNVCSLGTVLELGPSLEFIGTMESGDPATLLPGDNVGPGSAGGVWLDHTVTPIGLIYEYGTASYVRNGFPEFTQDLSRFAIGFRLQEEDSYYYGYIDISLWRPSFFGDGAKYPVPVIKGIELADESDAPLTIVLIPEPRVIPLMILGVGLLWIWRKMPNQKLHQTACGRR